MRTKIRRTAIIPLVTVLLFYLAHPANVLLSGTTGEVRGLRGAVAARHYLVADVGMEILKKGGNATDAGVAMVLAASVVEFVAFGFGGEVPTLIYSPAEKRVVAINGNMRAPRAATIEWFKTHGYKLIPGDGFTPAGVSAVLAAMVLALDRYGTLSFAQVAEGAIRQAEGFPVYELWRSSALRNEKRFREEWPSSARLFLPGDRVPEIGEVARNPELADTFRRLVEAEQRALKEGKDRHGALQAVHDFFYKGPIAKQIVQFVKEFKVKDAEGGYNHGLLSLDDFYDYQARVEEPWSINYRGYDVYKCGPWTQGPVFLQQLALLEGYDLASMGHNSAEYLHLWLETAKLAHADKEKYYGDPAYVYVPQQGLLSKEYAASRRKLIDPNKASLEQRPGDPFPFDAHPEKRPKDLNLDPVNPLQDSGTVGVRAVDAQGNMFSATPSGGWAWASPVIPGLGFALGTRAQMFYLEEGLAKSLAPGKQPSSSLTPTLVMKDGQPYLAFGTPGGDRQDQITLQFFLNVVDFGMGLQDAVDAPRVSTRHFPSLFYPHRAHPGKVRVRSGHFPDNTVEVLEAKGHVVEVSEAPRGSGTNVVMRDPKTGTLAAAVGQRRPASRAASLALAW